MPITINDIRNLGAKTGGEPDQVTIDARKQYEAEREAKRIERAERKANLQVLIDAELAKKEQRDAVRAQKLEEQREAFVTAREGTPAEREARDKAHALHLYIEENGSPQGFEGLWHRIRDQLRVDRTVAAVRDKDWRPPGYRRLTI